jgi:oligoribonuclease
MRYVSLDLETTGLDPETCQIIEFAAVIDDLKDQKPLESLPKFHCYVKHELYKGEAYALGMHAEIFKKLAFSSPEYLILPDYAVIPSFGRFLLDNGYQGKVIMAGKNFNGFDRNFINKLPKDNLWKINFHHRAIDPGMLYYQKGDVEVPSTQVCMERAGVDGSVAHTALEDAYTVIKLIRNQLSG